MELNHPTELATVIFEDACAKWKTAARFQMKHHGELPDRHSRNHAFAVRSKVYEELVFLRKVRSYLNGIDITDSNLDALAEIVEHINSDIKNARTEYRHYSDDIESIDTMRECEDYFKSTECELHQAILGTEWPASRIISNLREQVNEMDCKRPYKSKRTKRSKEDNL